MRSKEVDRAIETLNKNILVDECWKNHDIDEIFKETHSWSLKTVLSYIETLEKLPNKIRDKIKELETYKFTSSKQCKKAYEDRIKDLKEIIEGEK